MINKFALKIGLLTIVVFNAYSMPRYLKLSSLGGASLAAYAAYKLDAEPTTVLKTGLITGGLVTGMIINRRLITRMNQLSSTMQHIKNSGIWQRRF